MPRHSREKELLYILTKRPDGLTFNELVNTENFNFEDSRGRRKVINNFPRKTLDRLLKLLIKKDLVEKRLEPRIKGKRGRQGKRYKIRSKILIVEREQNIGLGLKTQEYFYGIKVPHKEVKGVPGWPFFGTNVTRYGKTFVRLWPSEKKRMKDFEAMLKGHTEKLKRVNKSN